MYHNGRNIPYYKVFAPSWIGLLLGMGILGRIFFLLAHRPSKEDKSLGYVIEASWGEHVYYISETDQLISRGLWGLLIVYMCATFLYYVRLDQHKRIYPS